MRKDSQKTTTLMIFFAFRQKIENYYFFLLNSKNLQRFRSTLNIMV